MKCLLFLFSFNAICLFLVSGGKDNHKESHPLHEKSHGSAHIFGRHKKTEARVLPSSRLNDLTCSDGSKHYRLVDIDEDDQWSNDDGSRIPILPYKCPDPSAVYQANFTKREEVFLGPAVDNQGKPTWQVRNDGTEILITSNSDPGAALLNDSFSSLDFEGTFYVDTGGDDDYFGLIFSYQNNRTFYTVMWKKTAESYWRNQFLVIAEPGLHIMLVNSTTGPGKVLGDALWHTYSTTNQTKTIWYDDVKNVPWVGKKPYRWVLTHRPVIGLIRVKIFDGSNLIIDSGNVYDDTLLGGRIGVYDYSQAWVSWLNMTYKCNDNVTEEIWKDLPPRKRRILDRVVNGGSNNPKNY